MNLKSSWRQRRAGKHDEDPNVLETAASYYEDQMKMVFETDHPAHGAAKDFYWTEGVINYKDVAYGPVEPNDVKGAREWLDEEREDGHPFEERSGPIDEAITGVWGDDGKFYIWDGNHRYCMAVVYDLPLPAIIGRRKAVKTAGISEHGWLVLEDDLRVWQRASSPEDAASSKSVPSVVLPAGTRMKVLRRFKLGHGGSPDMAEVVYFAPEGPAGEGLPTRAHGVVRWADMRSVAAFKEVDHEKFVSVDSEGREFPCCSQHEGELNLKKLVGPADVPEMSTSDRQKRIDVLLDRWNQEPEQRTEIERHLRELRAFPSLWVRRAEDETGKHVKYRRVMMSPDKLIGTQAADQVHEPTILGMVETIKAGWTHEHPDLPPIIAVGTEESAEVMDGHHRVEAAKRAGADVPVLLIDPKVLETVSLNDAAFSVFDQSEDEHKQRGASVRRAEGADPAAGPFKAPWPDQIQAFMQAVYDQTVGHPFSRGQRVWDDQVIIEVHPWAGGPDREYPWIIDLKWIQAMTPGAGHARRCMEWLTALADEYGVFVELHAKPTGQPKIPKRDLKNFYKDQGFEKNPDQGPDDMRRMPKLSSLWKSRRAGEHDHHLEKVKNAILEIIRSGPKTMVGIQDVLYTRGVSFIESHKALTELMAEGKIKKDDTARVRLTPDDQGPDARQFTFLVGNIVHVIEGELEKNETVRLGDLMSAVAAAWPEAEKDFVARAFEHAVKWMQQEGKITWSNGMVSTTSPKPQGPDTPAQVETMNPVQRQKSVDRLLDRWNKEPAARPQIEEQLKSLRATSALWNLRRAMPVDRAYHGTNATEPFTEFEKTRDIGFHFSVDPDTANTMAEPYTVVRKDGEEAASPSRVYPVKLMIDNPLRMNDLLQWNPPDVIRELMMSSLAPKWKPFQYDETDFAEMADAEFDEKYADQLDRVVAEFRAAGGGEFRKGLEKFLADRGYDGIVYSNEIEGGGDSYIVFDQSKIQSSFEREAATPEMEQPKWLRQVLIILTNIGTWNHHLAMRVVDDLARGRTVDWIAQERALHVHEHQQLKDAVKKVGAPQSGGPSISRAQWEKMLNARCSCGHDGRTHRKEGAGPIRECQNFACNCRKFVETDNVSCAGCGRSDLPLHTDGRCPGCSKKTPLDGVPASVDEVPTMTEKQRTEQIDILLDRWQKEPKNREKIEQHLKSLRAFSALFMLRRASEFSLGTCNHCPEAAIVRVNGQRDADGNIPHEELCSKHYNEKYPRQPEKKPEPYVYPFPEEICSKCGQQKYRWMMKDPSTAICINQDCRNFGNAAWRAKYPQGEWRPDADKNEALVDMTPKPEGDVRLNSVKEKWTARRAADTLILDKQDRLRELRRVMNAPGQNKLDPQYLDWKREYDSLAATLQHQAAKPVKRSPLDVLSAAGFSDPQMLVSDIWAAFTKSGAREHRDHQITSIHLTGSRWYGKEQEGSDLDVVVFHTGQTLMSEANGAFREMVSQKTGGVVDAFLLPETESWDHPMSGNIMTLSSAASVPAWMRAASEKNRGGARQSLLKSWLTRVANDPLKKIIEINGVKVGIEWPKGSTRTWKHLPGNDYEKVMKADYGYIRQTEGEDGEEIDVYAGPDRDSSLAFVVTQLDKKTGEYDEDKIMLGYGSEAKAKASYMDHMEKAHFGGIKELSWEAFLKMVPKSQRVKEDPEKKSGGERQSLLSAWKKRAMVEGEFGWFQDNPITWMQGSKGREWLDSHPTTTTAGFNNIYLPVSFLITIPGEHNEQDNIDTENVDRITDWMTKSKDPIGVLGDAKPFVMVKADGTATVFEGNHRLRAAQKMGLESIPLWVHYEGGSELLDGPFSPDKLRAMTKTVTSVMDRWLRRAVRDLKQSEVGTITYKGKEHPVVFQTVDLKRWVQLRNDDRIINDPVVSKEWTELVSRMYLYAATKIEPNANIRESMNISLYPDIEDALSYYGYDLADAKQNISGPEGDAKLKQAVFSMFDQNGMKNLSPRQSADLMLNMAVVLRDEFDMSIEDAKAKLASLLIEYGGGGPENLHLNFLHTRMRRSADGEQKLLRELVCTVIGSDSGTTNEAVLPKGAVVGVQPWSNDHTIFFYSPIYSKIIVRGKVMKSNQYSAIVQDFRAATDIGYGEGTGYEHGPECFCDECMANDDMSTRRCPTCGSRECPGDGHSIDCRKPGTMTLKDVPTETRDSLLDKFNRGEIDEKTLRRRMKQITSSMLSRWRRYAAADDDRSDLQKMADQIHDFIKSNPKAERNDIIAHVEKLWNYKRSGAYDFGLENQVLSALGYLIEDEKRAKQVKDPVDGWVWRTMKEPLMTVEEHLRGVDVAPGSQPIDSVMDELPVVHVENEKDRLLDEFSKGSLTKEDLDSKMRQLRASALCPVCNGALAPSKSDPGTNYCPACDPADTKAEDDSILTMEQKVQALMYEIARDNESSGYVPDIEDLTREITNFMADEVGVEPEQVDQAQVKDYLARLEYPGWRNIATPENTKPDLPPGTRLNSIRERWQRRAAGSKLERLWYAWAGTSRPSAKDDFHKEAERVLNRLAKVMGLDFTDGSYEIRSNKAGSAVMGEVTLHSDEIYVQIGGRTSGQGREVMYRVVNGRGDYSGGKNNFMSYADVEDLNDAAAKIGNLLHKELPGRPKPSGAKGSITFETERGARYEVNVKGEIIRLDMKGFEPSGQWKLVGIRNPDSGEMIRFEDFRNGLPESVFEWEIIDFDHGSKRVWGEKLKSISITGNPPWEKGKKKSPAKKPAPVKVKPSVGGTTRMVETAIINLLRKGPSPISRDLHEILEGGKISVDDMGNVDSWDEPFAAMVSDVIGQMLDRGMILFDGETAEFSLLKEPEPTEPEHVPEMSNSDRQVKVDALLDQLSAETDPAKKQQIEQRLRSLRASLFSRWMSRVADVASRIPVLIKQFFAKEDPKAAESFIREMAKLDPTGDQGKYLTWILKESARRDAKGTPQGHWDNVKDLLAKYDKVKGKAKFPKESRDINLLSFEQLEEVVEKFGNVQTQRELALSGARIVRKDGDWRITEITSPESAASVCAGKTWCVKDPYYSERYLEKGPLYFVEDIEEGREYLVHPASGEVKDENNGTPTQEAPRLLEQLGDDHHVGEAISKMKIDVEDILRGIGDGTYDYSDIQTDDLGTALDLCINEFESYGYEIHGVVDEMLKRALPDLVSEYGSMGRPQDRFRDLEIGEQTLLKAVSVNTLAEAVLASGDPYLMAKFAVRVLHARWPQAESKIMAHENAKHEYTSEFDEDLALVPFYEKEVPGNPQAMPPEPEVAPEAEESEELPLQTPPKPEPKEGEPYRYTQTVEDLQRDLEQGQITQQKFDDQKRRLTRRPWKLPAREFFDPAAVGQENWENLDLEKAKKFIEEHPGSTNEYRSKWHSNLPYDMKGEFIASIRARWLLRRAGHTDWSESFLFDPKENPIPFPRPGQRSGIWGWVYANDEFSKEHGTDDLDELWYIASNDRDLMDAAMREIKDPAFQDEGFTAMVPVNKHPEVVSFLRKNFAKLNENAYETWGKAVIEPGHEDDPFATGQQWSGIAKDVVRVLLRVYGEDRGSQELEKFLSRLKPGEREDFVEESQQSGMESMMSGLQDFVDKATGRTRAKPSRKTEMTHEDAKKLPEVDVQVQTDRLLEQLQAETDPEKKRQIEERLKSIQASIKGRWALRRAGEAGELKEHRRPGGVDECSHGWPGKKPGEKGWCGRCGL